MATSVPENTFHVDHRLLENDSVTVIIENPSDVLDCFGL